MSNTEIVTLPGNEPTMNLARFLPQDIGELVRFADTVSKSGLFGSITPQQTTVLMMYGAELGLNPLAAMREIYLIPGRNGRIQMLPSAALTSARIQQSDDCEAWEADVDDRHCTIRFKRKGRQPQTVTVTIEDIPARYFEPSKSGQPSQWKLIPSDMLYAWTVRRVARRHFADKLIAIQPEADEIDETRVIDVAKVERETGYYGQGVHEGCGGHWYLHANRNGGAFLSCDRCGATQSPPQEVRDAIRGVPEHLTLAGAPEPVLEPGEREVTPEELEQLRDDLGIEPPTDAGREFLERVDAATVSAVQSESERDTIDVAVAVPASAENAPIPEPEAAAESAQERHQALRNAVYAHWILPRPTGNKIAMRELLEEFGWTGGDTLGDWLLPLHEDKLAAIADAVAGIA
jgi:hypothetical protein